LIGSMKLAFPPCLPRQCSGHWHKPQPIIDPWRALPHTGTN
jgi:hypothetical protein